MKNELLNKCEALIENKEALKSVLAWNDNRIQTMCAILYCAADKKASATRVKYCMDMLSKKAGLFSEIRGMTKPVLACMIDIRGGEEAHFDQLIEAYNVIKTEFWSSSHLTLAAQIIAEHYAPDEYQSVVLRAKGLYKSIREQHPFLTGQDDYVMSVILAMSDRNDEELIDEIERCYRYLKTNAKRFPANAIQGISHVLAQYNTYTEQKCQAVIDLYNTFKSARRRFDKYYGMSTMALLSQADTNYENIVSECAEASDWLKQHKGFGNFALGESTRMVYSAILLNQCYSSKASADYGAINGTIAALIAEQVAMMACVTAVVVSSSSS